jgi:NADPH:quinone reductase-like Zn-dependent oxidoreductase
MKAWAIKKYGDGTELQLMDLPKPQIRPDEILIQMKAASLNPVDFKIRQGDLKFILRYKFPLILGNDGAGVVVEKGSAVTKFKIGDEVYTRPRKERIGTLAEYLAADEASVALKPKNISFEEAASLPLVGLTSWQALLTRGNLQKGQKVFIPAGAGGVGSFAIQLARHAGAFIATTTSTKNIEFVKSLGADQVIDYSKEDFSKILKDCDLVFDTMGGEIRDKGFSVLKPNGKLISIVRPPTAEFVREVNGSLLVKCVAGLLSLPTLLRAKYYGAKYIFMFMLPSGDDLAQIRKLVENGSIKPIIDKVYPFESVREAFAHIESGRARGKIIVRVS